MVDMDKINKVIPVSVNSLTDALLWKPLYS